MMILARRFYSRTLSPLSSESHDNKHVRREELEVFMTAQFCVRATTGVVAWRCAGKKLRSQRALWEEKWAVRFERADQPVRAPSS